MRFPSLKTIWNLPVRIAEIYGTLIALGLVAFFFIMYAVGLVYVIELRFLNLFIMLAGVYGALKQYRRTHHDHLNYFRGLTIGVVTATIGASTFAVFLMLYLKIDTGLLQDIIANEPMGRYLNEYVIAAAIITEGTFSGCAITYILMNVIESDKATEMG